VSSDESDGGSALRSNRACRARSDGEIELSRRGPRSFSVWPAVLSQLPITRPSQLQQAEPQSLSSADTKDWLAPLWEVSDRLALEEPPRLLRAKMRRCPSLAVCSYATIVLPAECDSWSLDRRRRLLLHELAHVAVTIHRTHAGASRLRSVLVPSLSGRRRSSSRSESERADTISLSPACRRDGLREHLLDIVTSVRRDADAAVAASRWRVARSSRERMLAILGPELATRVPVAGNPRR